MGFFSVKSHWLMFSSTEMAPNGSRIRVLQQMDLVGCKYKKSPHMNWTGIAGTKIKFCSVRLRLTVNLWIYCRLPFSLILQKKLSTLYKLLDIRICFSLPLLVLLKGAVHVCNPIHFVLNLASYSSWPLWLCVQSSRSCAPGSVDEKQSGSGRAINNPSQSTRVLLGVRKGALSFDWLLRAKKPNCGLYL